MGFKIALFDKQRLPDIRPSDRGVVGLVVTDDDLNARSFGAVDQDGNVMSLGSFRNSAARYELELGQQGNTGAASVLRITAKDLSGELAIGRDNDLVRVAVFNSGTYTESTNATLAASNGSLLECDYGDYAGQTAAKDLVLRPSNQAFASLTTSLSGSDNDLVFTAVTRGNFGNGITVAYINPGTVSADETVVVTNQAIVFNLATDAGTAQVETATVTAVAGATENGVLTVVVTAAGVTGSPLSIPVTLTTADDDADKVATAIRAALTANAALAALWTAGGTGANVTLTRVASAANDATLNIAWGAYVAGITAVVTSTGTTPGVAPAITSTADTIKTTLLASAAASALVTAANAGADNGTGVVTALGATALTGGGAGNNATWFLRLTDAQAETVTVRIGPPPFRGVAWGDYSSTLDVAHAAP